MDYTKLHEITSDYCRYIRNGDDRAAEKVCEFYTLGKESPSVARMILTDENRKSVKYLQDQFVQDTLSLGYKDAKAKFQNGIYNIMNFGTEIDYREQVKPFMEEYSKTFETLYKKTGLLRIKLIDTGRVLIDKVTPKASKLHKFLYWRNAVPKEVTKMLKKVAK